MLDADLAQSTGRALPVICGSVYETGN